MGKILLWRPYNEREPPQITYEDNEEGKELQTFISSFQENMKNEVRVLRWQFGQHMRAVEVQKELKQVRSKLRH